MTDPTQQVGADARTLITYAACTNACIALLDADLLPHEREWLQRILDRLTDMGFITLATVGTPPLRLRGIDDVIGHLHSVFGVLVVDAAVGAAGYPASPIESPQALIPMTKFERDHSGGDRLIAMGRLFASDLEFEAVAVRDGVRPSSISAPDACTDRGIPTCDDPTVGTVCLPGLTGTYAIFATMRST